MSELRRMPSIYNASLMSPEIRACVAPAAAYAALARRPSSITRIGALRRPLVAAVVLGAAMALSSTRHLTPQLLFDSTILWSVVVAAQVAIALALVAGPSRRTVGPARALDLF